MLAVTLGVWTLPTTTSATVTAAQAASASAITATERRARELAAPVIGLTFTAILRPVVMPRTGADQAAAFALLRRRCSRRRAGAADRRPGVAAPSGGAHGTPALEDLLGLLPFNGEMVLAAQEIVIHPGRVWLARVNLRLHPPTPRSATHVLFCRCCGDATASTGGSEVPLHPAAGFGMLSHQPSLLSTRGGPAPRRQASGLVLNT